MSIINTAMRPDSLQSVATPYFESRETISSQARQRKLMLVREIRMNMVVGYWMIVIIGDMGLDLD